MAEKLKNLFSKKKDGKFKGKGHKLNEPSSSGKKVEAKSKERTVPCDDARQAGLAALARLTNNNPKSQNWSLAYQHDKLEMELKGLTSSRKPDDKPTENQKLAVDDVFFQCPFIGPEVLSKDEWKKRIREFLYEQLEEEKGLTACLIIHNLNPNKEKVAQCVETLTTYLSNILENPDEPKYKRIRISNKIFQDKVANIEGTMEFLNYAGFEKKKINVNDVEEDFLVYESEVDSSHLELLLDSLTSAQRIPIEVYRNPLVLLPSDAVNMIKLPDSFFTLTIAELKKEQQNRSEVLERDLQLRTKAMREKEEQRELKKYKYALIRIRFPDALILQGTFNIYEKLSSVIEFVRENIRFKGNFSLKTAMGRALGEFEEDQTLLELKLVPAVLLTFMWTEPGKTPESFLKPELIRHYSDKAKSSSQ